MHGSVHLALTWLLRAVLQVYLCTPLDARQPQRDGSQHRMAAAKRVAAAAGSPINTATQEIDAHGAATDSGELVELPHERAMSLLLLGCSVESADSTETPLFWPVHVACVARHWVERFAAFFSAEW